MMQEWWQKLQRRTPLGWLQLSHEKTRLLVAFSGIAFADILIFMQLGFQNALYDSSTQLHHSLAADVVLMSPQARNLTYMQTFPRRRLYQAMNLPEVVSADSLYVTFVDWKNPQTQRKTSMLVMGYNPNQSAFTLPEINANTDLIKLPDTFLFDAASRGAYDEAIEHVRQGQRVTTEIDRRTITVAGLFKVGASFGADGTLVTSDQNFLRLFSQREPGTPSIGLLQLQPGADAEQVAQVLNDYLPDDARALTLEQFVAFEKDYWANNTAIGFIFSIGAMMGFVVGVIIVYQILSTDVNDHMAEYATFKAMGYRNRFLLGVIFEEALILGILGFIPGTAVSFGLYALTRQATNLPIYMTVIRAIQVLVATIIMCTLSGAIATRRLQSADPADIF